MKYRKKIILSLSLIATVAAPLATVISCSNNGSKPKPVTNDQEKVNEIAKAIKVTKFILPVNTNLDVTNQGTISALNDVLIKANSGVSRQDVTDIVYSAKTKLSPNNKVDVTATIKINAASKAIKLGVVVTPTPQQHVNDLVGKFNVRKLTLPQGTPDDINNPETAKALDKVVLKANPQLTETDMAKYVSYSGSLVYNPTTPSNINAQINVSGVTQDINLLVTLRSTAAQKAQKIFDTITTKDITVPVGTIADTSDAFTIKAIDDSIIAANPKLKIFSDIRDSLIIKHQNTLLPNVSLPIAFNIKVENAVKPLIMNIKLMPTNQQLLSVIKNLIVNTDISLVMVTVKTKTPASEYASHIDAALFNVNKGLKIYKEYISYTGDLTPGVKSRIQIHLNVNPNKGAAAVDDVALDVSTNLSPAQKVANIVAKVKDTDITVPASTSTSPEAYTTVLNTLLQKANPTLTDYDLKTISYTGNLSSGIAAEVTATIKVGGAEGNVSLHITLQTPQKYVDGIMALVNNSNIAIPKGNSLDASKNKQVIDTTIKKKLPNLTTTQLSTLSYSGTLVPGTEPVAIKVTSSYQGKNQVGSINVVMNKTDMQLAQQIKNKITVTNFHVTLPILNIDNKTDTRYLDTDMQQANPTLTSNDLSKITYSGILLENKQVEAKATIKINDAKLDVTLGLTYESPKSVSTLINKQIIALEASTGASEPITLQAGMTDQDASKYNASINTTIFSEAKISDYYKEFVTYSGKITPNETQTITAHINVLGTKIDLPILVKSPKSSAQKVADIVKKITHLNDITISGIISGNDNKINTSYSGNKGIIDEAIKNANPLLTPGDLTYISYSGDLQYNSDAQKMNIKIDVDGASHILQIAPTVLPQVALTYKKEEASRYRIQASMTLTRSEWNYFIRFYNEDMGGGKITPNNLQNILGHFWQFISSGAFSGNSWTGWSNSPVVRELSEGGVFKYGWGSDFFNKGDRFGDAQHYGPMSRLSSMITSGSHGATTFATWIYDAMKYAISNPSYTAITINMTGLYYKNISTEYGYDINNMSMSMSHYGKVVKSW